MVTALMMSAKYASLGLLKIKAFWNKCYDVIISIHGVPSKILSSDSVKKNGWNYKSEYLELNTTFVEVTGEKQVGGGGGGRGALWPPPLIGLKVATPKF